MNIDGRNHLLTRRVFRWYDYSLDALLSLALVWVVARFCYGWFSLEAWATHPLILGIVTIVVTRKVMEICIHWALLPTMIDPLPLEPKREMQVAMATTFVPGREPIDMLRAPSLP